MKKAIGQTVRDLKRGVSKKVLKVPSIEQKVLDATSNEPWGPHGALLFDIAYATRNYHEYSLIMGVIWKRINDTGKNWRHVYKALIVLEYLVANGAERVIDEIKEHAYQISTLSGFQYIDSSGRDQGLNVRRKSQSLVVLVNDKEKIIEVREKAAANRDKFRPPGHRRGTYDDDRYEGRYGSRDRDRSRYDSGRERDYSYRDDDRYGKQRDSYGPERDQYGRDYEERYSRNGYKDDDYRRRSRSVEPYSPKSQSIDMERDRFSIDTGSYSTRADDQFQHGWSRRLEQKLSEKNNGAPPSYEEAVSESKSPSHTKRNEGTSPANDPEISSPQTARSQPAASSPLPAPKDDSTATTNNPDPDTTSFAPSVSPSDEVKAADDFDPRNSFSTPPSTSAHAEVDFFSSRPDSFSPNPSTSMTPTPNITASNGDVQANISGSPTQSSQFFDDPFGEAPFRANPSVETDAAQQQTSVLASATPFQPNVDQLAIVPHADLNKELSVSNQEIDVLADILPPSGLPPIETSQSGVVPSSQFSHSGTETYDSFNPQAIVPFSPNTGDQSSQFGGGSFSAHGGSMAPSNMALHNPNGQSLHFNSGNMPPQGIAPYMSHNANQMHSGLARQSSSGNYFAHPGAGAPESAQDANQIPTGSMPQFSSGNFSPQQQSHAFSQFNNGNFPPQQGHTFAYQTPTGPAPHFNSAPPSPTNSYRQSPSYSYQAPTGPTPHFNSAPQSPRNSQQSPSYSYQTPTGPTAQHNSDVPTNMFMQGSNTSIASQLTPPPSIGSNYGVPQPSNDRFETKSTVWADTLSRGLVNLNIDGPKTNPLADIGIDFDAMNRKEKRLEKPKPTSSAVTSTITMGKAMGSGSGLGRAGANTLRAPSNPMVGSGMGMGGGPGMSMGLGGYGGMNQPMGMGMNQGMNQSMGMGMNQGMNQSMGMGMGINQGMNQSMGMGVNQGMNQPMGMGMGMNRSMNMGMGMGMGRGMNYGQGGQMQPPTGYPSNMPGAYNPVMGPSGCNQQQYGSGYR